jgi:gliding motility associated protien GldN
MKNVMKGIFAGTIALGLSTFCFAQEADTRGYNPNSVRPIHESDIMFKKTVWTNVDLNEKQNRPFMAVNNEITRFVINAVKAGLLTPYSSDSLTTKLSVEEFVKNISAVGTQLTPEDKKFEIQRVKEDDFLTPEEKKQRIAEIERGGGGSEYPPSYFTQMELKEDFIFDKQRSRAYWDIQAITFWLPAEKNGDLGIQKKMASFKFKDLHKLFKSSPNAVYFNSQNNQEHKNLSDAFEMRLFAGRIIKVSNPDDRDLTEIYDGGKKGLLASEWMKQQLMEFEHNLWEF